MKETRFRAWDKIYKVMRLLTGFNYPNNYNIDLFGILNQSTRMMKTNVILLQYIGIKDKNEKEIYEGDIVESSRYSNDDRFLTVIKDIRYLGDYTWLRGSELNWNKVIGNIYENPELLKTSEVQE